MRKFIASLVFFASATAFAQHDHMNMDPPDTTNVPAALKDPFKSNDPSVQETRKEVIKKLYNGLIHPAAIPVLKGTVSVEDIFQKGVVQGRVSPAGSYSDFTSAMEYFYALAETPRNHVDAIDFRSLVSADEKVAVEVDLHFCLSPYTKCDVNVIDDEQNFLLKEIGFFTFNQENRVISFDLVIPNLGAKFDLPSQKLKDDAILQMCVGLTVLHQDPITDGVKAGGTCTKFFDSPEDFPLVGRDKYGSAAFQNCVQFMHSIPYGSWNRVNSNTVVCRQLHTILTAIRPDDHCPHVSADGGGKCIDFPYSDYFKTDY